MVNRCRTYLVRGRHRCCTSCAKAAPIQAREAREERGETPQANRIGISARPLLRFGSEPRRRGVSYWTTFCIFPYKLILRKIKFTPEVHYATFCPSGIRRVFERGKAEVGRQPNWALRVLISVCWPLMACLLVLAQHTGRAPLWTGGAGRPFNVGGPVIRHAACEPFVAHGMLSCPMKATGPTGGEVEGC
jgi:hypothetical protein